MKSGATTTIFGTKQQRNNVAFIDLYSLYLNLHWRPLDFQLASDVCYVCRDFSSKCLRWIISSIDPLGHRRFIQTPAVFGAQNLKIWLHQHVSIWVSILKTPKESTFFVLCLCQAGDSNLFASEGVFFPQNGVVSHCFPKWWDDEREPWGFIWTSFSNCITVMAEKLLRF